MKTISVSDAKATLSQQIRHVKRGGQILITERGRPVARLVPVDPIAHELEDLVAAGVLRVGTGALPRGFWSLARPTDEEGSVRAAVREERETGW